MLVRGASMQGVQRDGKLTRRWDLLHTGVSTDAATPRMAWLMALTSLLYLVVEVRRALLEQHTGAECVHA